METPQAIWNDSSIEYFNVTRMAPKLCYSSRPNFDQCSIIWILIREPHVVISNRKEINLLFNQSLNQFLFNILVKNN